MATLALVMGVLFFGLVLAEVFLAYRMNAGFCRDNLLRGLASAKAGIGGGFAGYAIAHYLVM